MVRRRCGLCFRDRRHCCLRCWRLAFRFASSAALWSVSLSTMVSVRHVIRFRQDFTHAPSSRRLRLTMRGKRTGFVVGQNMTEMTTTVATKRRRYCTIHAHSNHGPGRTHPPGRHHHSSVRTAATASESLRVSLPSFSSLGFSLADSFFILVPPSGKRHSAGV